jgi:hypothetical protein
LSSFILSIKGLPLPDLLGLLPPLPNLSGLSALAAGISASMSLGGISLPSLPPISLSLVAKLEAMAMVSAHLGINPLLAGSLPKLSIAINSINAHLPSAMGSLLGLLGPFLPKLNLLLDLATVMQSFRLNLGIDLALPGAAARLSLMLPKLSLALALPSLSVAANVTAAARLSAALSVLGILGNPLPALSLAARISLPALSIDLPKLGALSLGLCALMTAKNAFGFSLSLPSLKNLLKALIPNLNIALALAIPGPVMAAAGVASARLALGMNLSAAASLSASLALPDLGGLASISFALSLMGPVLALSPCMICKFLK